MEQRLQVGIITASHGLKGEVKVYPTTDDPARFRRLKQVILDSGKETRTLEIEGVKFFKQLVILKFKGLDDINDVEKFRKASLYVTRDNAVRLKKDEFFIADLIDMTVETEDGTVLGTLRDVITTGANDVYEVTLLQGGSVLIPAIKECILEVDVEQARMRVHLLDGLLDLGNDGRGGNKAVSYTHLMSGRLFMLFKVWQLMHFTEQLQRKYGQHRYSGLYLDIPICGLFKY